MNKQNVTYLPLEYNIHSARLFLNLFNLTLEKKENININSERKIFDKNNKKVGSLKINEKKIIISVEYEDFTLSANYDLQDIIGEELVWSNAIKFSTNDYWNKEITGKITINSIVDYEYGLKSSCQSILKTRNLEETTTLKMLNGSSLFNVKIESKNKKETINIDLTNQQNGYIVHRIESEKENKGEDISKCSYNFLAGIFPAVEAEENSKNLFVFLNEEEKGETIRKYKEYVKRVVPTSEEREETEVLIQKGLLMQKMNPMMHEKIKELKTTFSICDIPLLENLFSICYDDYTDEELKALLGIDRKTNKNNKEEPQNKKIKTKRN